MRATARTRAARDSAARLAVTCALVTPALRPAMCKCTSVFTAEFAGTDETHLFHRFWPMICHWC
jgi:hypothetical protein